MDDEIAGKSDSAEVREEPVRKVEVSSCLDLTMTSDIRTSRATLKKNKSQILQGNRTGAKHGDSARSPIRSESVGPLGAYCHENKRPSKSAKS